MPNDRIFDCSPFRFEAATSTPAGQGLARLQTPPPVFLGHSRAARAVQQAIVAALGQRGPVLIHGPIGSGKHTVARMLHHFGGGDIEALETVTIDGGRCGPLAPFAYLAPVELLAADQQMSLPNRIGLSRVILGTRLDPDSPEGRARLSSTLLHCCQARIALPSLAERVEDVELLAMALLQRLPARGPVGGISEDAIDCLRSYAWPGNVSELEAVMRFALARARGPWLEPADLPPKLSIRAVGEISPKSPEQLFSLANAEREAVRRAMRHARGNKRRAARLLQIGKTTLYRKLALL